MNKYTITTAKWEADQNGEGAGWYAMVERVSDGEIVHTTEIVADEYSANAIALEWCNRK